jgi:hypothetical protein
VSDGGETDALVDAASYLTCFDATRTLYTWIKSCHIDSDCVAKVDFTDCCGTVLYVGVNNRSVSEFDTCEASWEAHFLGPCMCQPKPTQTEDGNTIYSGVDAASPGVRCTPLPDNSGLCMTYAP